MNKTILIPPTEAELLAFLPLARAREACFLTHSRQDETLKDYIRAAYDDAQDEARASFLPQTIRATFTTPYGDVKAFGLETKVVDLDGVQGSLRLPLGPVRGVTKISYLDRSSQPAEDIATEHYRLDGKFLYWNNDFRWANDRPSFAVEYIAGLPDAHPKLASIRVAIFEVLAVKWDSKGGNYAMPTSARRVFHSLRTSRTRNPGA